MDRVMGLVDGAVMGTGSGWLPRPRDESRTDMVDEIVLVGGGARMPKLRQLIEDYFHGRRPNSRKGGNQRTPSSRAPPFFPVLRRRAT